MLFHITMSVVKQKSCVLYYYFTLANLRKKAFTNIIRKMLVTSIFSFSSNVFYPIKGNVYNPSHIELKVCIYFSFRQA